jgi:hypothetical protein
MSVPLFSYIVYSSGPKMEAVGSSEAFVPCCENLISVSLLQLSNHSYEKVQIYTKFPTVSMWLYENKITWYQVWPPLWSSGQNSWLPNGDVSFFLWGTNCYVQERRLPLWSGCQRSWLQIQRSRVRFLALPDFLRSGGSGMGSTQPHEYNWRATWKK